MFERLVKNVRFGLRSLGKNPLFTAVAVLCLSLGIGANSAIFSVVEDVLLSPLPFEEPEELVRVYTVRAQADGTEDRFSLAPLTYIELVDEVESFENLAVTRDLTLSLVGDGEPERLQAASATANLFELLGVEPLQGRTFTELEDRPNGPAVAVLRHSFWQRRFGADPSIIGRTVNLDGTPYTVVGVMPEGFAYPAQAELWVPMGLDFDVTPDGTLHILSGVARLAEGVDIGRAQQEMTSVAGRLARDYPDLYGSLGLSLLPFRERVIEDGDKALVMLQVAVGFVLLIACTAVASLILARGSTVSMAVAVRTALGASRRQLIGQFLTESLLLAFIASGVGLVFAWFVVPLLGALVPASFRPYQDLSIDLEVLGFTFVVALVTSVVVGLAPAIRFSGVPPQTLLRGTRRTGGRVRGQSLQSMLVVVELAIAVVLLIGTGLMIRSFRNLVEISPGFNPEDTLVLKLNPPEANYPEPQQLANFANQVVERLARLPGVSAAGLTTTLPITDRERNRAARFSVEGQLPENPGDVNVEIYRMVTPDLFEALGIPLLRGRTFTERDRADSPGVVVVSQAMAERYWPGQDPLGKRLKRGTYDSEDPWLTVVGVVGNVKDDGLENEDMRTWYLPFPQNPTPVVSLAVKVPSGDPLALADPARQAIWEIDPDLPVHSVTTMEDVVRGSLDQRRFNSFLVGSFSLFGLLLAAVGLYGLMGIQVAQRTSEISMRMALGAERRDILRMMLGKAVLLTALGLTLGLVVALPAAERIRDLLFRVEPMDPLTVSVIVFVLGASTLAASFLPALRATRIQPVEGLRSE